MAKDAVFSGEREVRTFVDLSHGSDVMLLTAKDREKGSYYTAMSSLLLRAFTFEAYLNHLGTKKTEFWSHVESIRVMDKYAVLCKTLSVEPDFSRRPYQTVGKLFRFRNAIAHGRSVVLKNSKDVSSDDEPYQHMPKAEWEEYSTIENAERAKEDISAVIVELHKAAGLGDYPFIHGMGIGSMSIKPSNSAQQRTGRDRPAAERKRYADARRKQRS
jgi:hypothetical protein